MSTSPDDRLKFFEQTPASLATFGDEHGWPGFLAKQLLSWVYEKGITNPDAMSDIALRHRETIAKRFT
ncbi:MAG: hypothetical protein O7G85_06995, partial [Planctomycetota bacterium]|nr:hypothetical protein [Planctomycetota bacterium]